MPARSDRQGVRRCGPTFSARDGEVAGPAPGGAREIWKPKVILGGSHAHAPTLVFKSLLYVGRHLHSRSTLDSVIQVLALRPWRGRVPTRACALNCAFLLACTYDKDRTLANFSTHSSQRFECGKVESMHASARPRGESFSTGLSQS